MKIDMESNQDIVQKINDYLFMGGLFNPELANHEEVRDLLISIRDYMDKEEKGREK